MDALTKLSHDRLSRLRELASAFRCAIERTDRKKLPVTLQEFPKACGETALLLGTFLKNRGMGSFEYVCGWRNGYSHAWLEADGIIIDITADSFPDQSEQVIVTTCSLWHGGFERRGRPHEADYRLYDRNTVKQCGWAYNIVVEQIGPTGEPIIATDGPGEVP
jgi:hypothetical protein